jgi:acetyltransferase-like isoleucine patch superfamily enzyme
VTIDLHTKVCKGVRFFLGGGTIQIGRNCTISEFVIFTCGADISLQDNVTVDRFATLQADQASLSVGSGTTIGQSSHLWAHTGQITLGARNTLGKSNTWVGTGSGIAVADQCDFAHHVTVDSSGGRISIAEGSGVGPGSLLYGHGGLQIGSGCAIAGLTCLVAGNHKFSQPGIPLRKQGVQPMPIVVGDNVWIGAGVEVLGNSHIGDDVVVGAGAVVTAGQIDSRSVVVGNPARPLRHF